MTQVNVFVRHQNILERAFRGLILAMGTAVLSPKRMLHLKNLAAVQCAQALHNQQAQQTRK